MNFETFAGFMTIAFGVIGSWGLYKQIHKIWFVPPRSAESISAFWSIANIAMFAGFFIYGLRNGSTPLTFLGAIRVVFMLPILIGFMKYGERKPKHSWWIVSYTIALTGMALEQKLLAFIFVGLQAVSILSGLTQAYKIWSEESRGRVSLESQIVILLSVSCWELYALARKDVLLAVMSAGFMLSYSIIICMWLKYPGPPTKR